MMSVFTWQMLVVAGVVAAIVVLYPPAPGEMLWQLPAGWLPAAGYVAGAPPQPARTPVAWLDLYALPDDEAAHLAEGNGSVLSIVNTPEDETLISERERQAQIDAWINDPVVWSESEDDGPLRRIDAAMAAFLAPLQPVEQAHIAVDNWKLETPTGELPRVPALIGVSA